MRQLTTFAAALLALMLASSVWAQIGPQVSIVPTGGPAVAQPAASIPSDIGAAGTGSCAVHKFEGADTSTGPTCSQPSCGDISDAGSFCNSTNLVNASGTLSPSNGGFALYQSDGTAITGATVHQVLISGQSLSGSPVTISLSGSAVFTSSSSFGCSCTDVTAENACSVAHVSGSEIHVSGNTSDSADIICVGN